VIERLEVANSEAISDRIENAVVIFADFFDSKQLKLVHPELACSIINQTFILFDSYLKERPMFEKIKVYINIDYLELSNFNDLVDCIKQGVARLQSRKSEPTRSW
jgi:hypothetical protein